MKSNSVVCVGSTYFSGLKISEVAQEENFQQIVYDRSRKNLKVTDLDSFLKENICVVQPSKIFLNIGDVDFMCEDFKIDEFISKYEWALFNLHNSCRQSRIYILSVASPCAKEVNDRLKELAWSLGCDFVDISFLDNKNSGREVFHVIKNYMREFPIGFFDAMRCA